MSLRQLADAICRRVAHELLVLKAAHGPGVVADPASNPKQHYTTTRYPGDLGYALNSSFALMGSKPNSKGEVWIISLVLLVIAKLPGHVAKAFRAIIRAIVRRCRRLSI
jgi:hypothetical protein